MSESFVTVSSNPQTPTAFHGALSAVTTATGNCVGVVGAVRILAMPEMQIIRELLADLRSDRDCGRQDGNHYYDAYDTWARIERDHPSIVKWVDAS